MPDVGYLRLLNAEGLLSLQPSLILASELAYPSAVLSQISAAGIPVVTVSAAAELPAITAKVRQIAEALALQSAAAVLVADINRKLDAVPQTPLPVNVLFLLSHAGTAPMAAGTDTAADSLIRSAGGRNAAASFRRYRPLSAEGMIAAQPDLVVITRSGLASLGSTGNLWQLRGWLRHLPENISGYWWLMIWGFSASGYKPRIHCISYVKRWRQQPCYE